MMAVAAPSANPSTTSLRVAQVCSHRMPCADGAHRPLGHHLRRRQDVVRRPGHHGQQLPDGQERQQRQDARGQPPHDGGRPRGELGRMDRCQRVPHRRLRAARRASLRPGRRAAGRGRSTSTRRATDPGRGGHDRDPIRQRAPPPRTECVTRITVRGRSSQSALQLGVERLAAQGVERARTARPAAAPAGRRSAPAPGRRAAPSRRTARAAAGRRRRPGRPAPAPSRARAFRSAGGTPRSASGSATLSSVDSHGRRRGCWKAMPTRPSPARGGPPGSPPIVTWPPSGRSRPAISRSSVDLPQPLGPMTTVKLPAGTSSEQSVQRHQRPAARGKADGRVLDADRLASGAWFAESRHACSGWVEPSTSGHAARPRSSGASAPPPDPAHAQAQLRTMRRRNASRSPSPFRTVTVGPVCR